MKYLISKIVEADCLEQAIAKSKRAKIHNCCILPPEKEDIADNSKDAIGFDSKLNDKDE